MKNGKRLTLVWGSMSVSLWARGLSGVGPGILCSLSVDEDEDEDDPGLWPDFPRARFTGLAIRPSPVNLHSYPLSSLAPKRNNGIKFLVT